MAKPLTYDHLRSRKKPQYRTVPIALDPERAGELEAARRDCDVAKARADMRPEDLQAAADLEAAAARLAELEQAMEAEGLVAYFKLRSVGRATYDDLVSRHPPTAQQRLDAKNTGIGDLAWNPESFPPALVAACLVEPELSLEQVQALWDDDNWNQAELTALLTAAIEVCGSRRTVDLGKGSGGTRTSVRRSATA